MPIGRRTRGSGVRLASPINLSLVQLSPTGSRKAPLSASVLTVIEPYSVSHFSQQIIKTVIEHSCHVCMDHGVPPEVHTHLRALATRGLLLSLQCSSWFGFLNTGELVSGVSNMYPKIWSKPHFLCSRSKLEKKRSPGILQPHRVTVIMTILYSFSPRWTTFKCSFY